MKPQHLVFLLVGIAISVLFFVFRETFYDTLYYNTEFNNNLYNLGLYNIFAIVTIAFTWLGAAVYYYAINSVRFDRWWHWLIVLAIVCVLCPAVCYIISLNSFARAGMDYAFEAFVFQVTTLVWAALLFIVASFSMRWWSSNCRHTPFPQ